jgi:prephenate dehydrogenase
MPIRKITIAGCGLIGGSLGSALRTSGFQGKITGCDQPEVLDKALRLGAIDNSEPALESAVQDADLVVLATPISSILALLPVVASNAPAHALITDTGSTKAEIVNAAKALFGASMPQRFLAGHPIAGKERSGIEQADPYLFRGAKWVFTPISPQQTQPSALHGAPHLRSGGGLTDENESYPTLRKDGVGWSTPLDVPSARVSPLQAEWVELIRGIGALPVCMQPEEHDLVLAFTSHLPQLLSIALANTVLEELRPEAGDGGYGSVPYGGGLRDMTRLAKSDPLVWRDILATNGENIRRALEELQRQISNLSSALAEENLEEIQQAFRAAARIAKLS